MKVRIPRRSLLGQYLQSLEEGTLATQVSHYAQMGFELAARGHPVVSMAVAVPTEGAVSNRIHTPAALPPAASAVVGDDFIDDIGELVK